MGVGSFFSLPALIIPGLSWGQCSFPGLDRRAGMGVGQGPSLENIYPYCIVPDRLKPYSIKDFLCCMVQENSPAAIFGSPPFLTPIHKIFREGHVLLSHRVD